MNDNRIDLSALDRTADAARFDRIVAQITDEASAELAARRARSNVIGQITRWTKPTLAAAASLAVISVATLTQIETTTARTADEPTLAEAIGVPAQVAEWLGNDESPTADQLLVALGGGEER